MRKEAKKLEKEDRRKRKLRTAAFPHEDESVSKAARAASAAAHESAEFMLGGDRALQDSTPPPLPCEVY